LLPDWSIQARAERCDITGRAFADGEHFYTLLERAPNGGLRRRDVSAESWRELRETPGFNAPFSFWRAKFTPPPPAAAEALPKEDAESLLRRFLQEGRPEHGRAAYILAIMLERKRLLRPTDSRDDATSGQRLLFYEHARTGEAFVVADPGLKLEQVAEVQQEVAALLGAARPAVEPALATAESLS
jgi:hypothetical protein